jgi:hypothetical protein
MATVTWMAWITGSRTAASAGIDDVVKPNRQALSAPMKRSG